MTNDVRIRITDSDGLKVLEPPGFPLEREHPMAEELPGDRDSKYPLDEPCTWHSINVAVLFGADDTQQS